jgi:hypothetical protein
MNVKTSVTIPLNNSGGALCISSDGMKKAINTIRTTNKSANI